MQKRKTAIVTARMTPEVKQRLQERAQDAHMTLTNYLIICGLGQKIVRVDGLDTVLSELKAQGRNLNQLTTLANMGRLTVLRSDELINSYAALCEQVSRLTEVS
nr:plasmid mobilization relaxosome protein MobC [uncultured Oscillibacter sp.]